MDCPVSFHLRTRAALCTQQVRLQAKLERSSAHFLSVHLNWDSKHYTGNVLRLKKNVWNIFLCSELTLLLTCVTKTSYVVFFSNISSELRGVNLRVLLKVPKHYYEFFTCKHFIHHVRFKLALLTAFDRRLALKTHVPIVLVDSPVHKYQACTRISVALMTNWNDTNNYWTPRVCR